MRLISPTRYFQRTARAIASFFQPKRLAILEACLIGLVSGLAAVLLKLGAGWLGSWRVYTAHNGPVLLWLPAVGLLGGLLAGTLVERFAPETSGSGIPQVKAALAGVGSSLNGRIAFVKLANSILVLASGLTLGRQGPTVQIGAAIAAQLSRWFPTSPDHRRQLIAAGAAAGLAAGFNAPIAGVLFVVEDLIYDLSSITLGPAIMASFIGAVVSRILGGQNLNLHLNLNESHITFSLTELPFYLILGILAGVFGALFHKGIVGATIFNRKILRASMPLRVGLAGLICGLLVAILPEHFRNNSGLREFLLTGEAGLATTAIAFITHFILTVVAAGSGAPGGLFAPSLILGSSLGYLVGLWQWDIVAIGEPSSYALAGMGAFFCAVSRAPITAVVIIFEITTDFNLVLPLMIATVVSYLVSESISSGSLYDELLSLNGINLKKTKATGDILNELKANKVMQSKVESLDADMSLDEAVQVFSASRHRGFPVTSEGQLVGIVSQTDLAKIDSLQLQGDMPLKDIMTHHPLTVSPLDTLSQVLYLLNRYQLSRLPVVEGRKLVGIITRSDIIRAESARLLDETQASSPSDPSYVVYQTRSPQLGRGRLLVPLANLETAPLLLKVALAIAKHKNYELECIQVIQVPRHNSPSQTLVRTTKARRLLQKATQMGEQNQVQVHTQIRVSHDIVHSILETIKERHIDLILMGWKGSHSTPGGIFGDIVDSVIRQAPCGVMLVKWANRETLSNSCPIPLFNRWLVPVAGGPNSQEAVKLLPALLNLGIKPEIRLCQIFSPSQSTLDATALKESKEFLESEVDFPIAATPIYGSSVSETTIEIANQYNYDMVMVGVTRGGLLQQAIQGNIPEAIARGCNGTVILVRGDNRS